MKRARKAFTLVEILIVVIILGILAAIVIPQFTSASEDAQISNVETQLSTIRAQIELYRVRNNSQYPDFMGALAGGWGDPAGATAAAQGLRGADYLRTDPVNPRTGLSTIIAGDTPTAADNAGWLWAIDPVTGAGEIRAARFNEKNEQNDASLAVGESAWLD